MNRDPYGPESLTLSGTLNVEDFWITRITLSYVHL
jgi:hypothetical protein